MARFFYEIDCLTWLRLWVLIQAEAMFTIVLWLISVTFFQNWVNSQNDNCFLSKWPEVMNFVYFEWKNLSVSEGGSGWQKVTQQWVLPQFVSAWLKIWIKVSESTFIEKSDLKPVFHESSLKNAIFTTPCLLNDSQTCEKFWALKLMWGHSADAS